MQMIVFTGSAIVLAVVFVALAIILKSTDHGGSGAH